MIRVMEDGVPVSPLCATTIGAMLRRSTIPIEQTTNEGLLPMMGSGKALTKTFLNPKGTPEDEAVQTDPSACHKKEKKKARRGAVAPLPALYTSERWMCFSVGDQ